MLSQDITVMRLASTSSGFTHKTSHWLRRLGTVTVMPKHFADVLYSFPTMATAWLSGNAPAIKKIPTPPRKIRVTRQTSPRKIRAIRLTNPRRIRATRKASTRQAAHPAPLQTQTDHGSLAVAFTFKLLYCLGHH